eukprot:357798-Chlamydomonas_euryale.AAC.1
MQQFGGMGVGGTHVRSGGATDAEGNASARGTGAAGGGSSGDDAGRGEDGGGDAHAEHAPRRMRFRKVRTVGIQEFQVRRWWEVWGFGVRGGTLGSRVPRGSYMGGMPSRGLDMACPTSTLR